MRLRAYCPGTGTGEGWTDLNMFSYTDFFTRLHHRTQTDAMKQNFSDSQDNFCRSSHLIHTGNCIDILPELPEKSVRLIFADPPYNLQLKQELYRPNQTLVDGVDDVWDQFLSFESYDEFTRQWLSACRRVLADDGTIWVIGSYHNIFRVGKIMMDLGYWILNDVQWHKTNPMPNFRGVRFTNATETLIWAKKSEKQKKYTFNHQVMKQLNDGKQMTSVWHIPLCTGTERIKDENGKKAHSTQKPEALLQRVILSSSNEGDTVLDPFSGSGTTCAVAKKLNRRSIGIEQEPRYVEIAENRLKSINSDLFQELRLTEPPPKRLQRVSMQELVEARYIRENQSLYSKDKTCSAIVLPDGRIQNSIGTGSIHKIGALLKDTESCNGWMYWYYEEEGTMKLLDEKRILYRENNGIQ